MNTDQPLDVTPTTKRPRRISILLSVALAAIAIGVHGGRATARRRAATGGR